MTGGEALHSCQEARTPQLFMTFSETCKGGWMEASRQAPYEQFGPQLVTFESC